MTNRIEAILTTRNLFEARISEWPDNHAIVYVNIKLLEEEIIEIYKKQKYNKVDVIFYSK